MPLVPSTSASGLRFTPTGSIESLTVQEALAELAEEKMALDITTLDSDAVAPFPLSNDVIPFSRPIQAGTATAIGEATGRGTPDAQITIGDKAYVIVAAGAVGDEIERGATAADYALNIATKVTEDTADAFCTCEADDEGLLFTANTAGAAGNDIVISTTDPNLTLNTFGDGADGYTATGHTNFTGAFAAGFKGAGVPLSADHPLDNTYTGTVIPGLNNTGGVTQWDAVYMGADSQWALANAGSVDYTPARGLAISTAIDAIPVSVLVSGTVRHDDWFWTPGGTIYLDETDGGLTQTAPSESGSQVQQIGFAISSDIAFFDFNSTCIEIA